MGLQDVHALGILLLSQHASALSLVRFSLHLFRDFDVHLEELCNTSIQADGLALVQLGFAVVVGNAFLGACVDESGSMLFSAMFSMRHSASTRTG